MLDEKDMQAVSELVDEKISASEERISRVIDERVGAAKKHLRGLRELVD